MKKYTKNRPLADIRRACKKNAWTYDEAGFRAGGDWVNFEFGAMKIPVLFNTFNGRFFANHEGKRYTEGNTEMDGVKWYADLLDFVYIP